MPSVSIVGVGRLGGALAIALSRTGYDVRLLMREQTVAVERVSSALDSRPEIGILEEIELIDSDVVLIAVPDNEIKGVAGTLHEKIKPGAVVLHTSGALSSSVLISLRPEGVSVGSMHPLASVSEPVSGASRFAGAYFCVEGDLKAMESAMLIARDLGGRTFSIDPDRKALYHAAAVMAAGHVVALFDASIETLSQCGIERGNAQAILAPLLQTSVENLKSQPPELALTGTYARADISTIERHLVAMTESVRDETVEIYVTLALRSIEIAERRGISSEKTAEMRDRILMAKRNTR